MTFLHTTLFLSGVACVSIPILIHLLLRQRRKPIAWAAMRFLLEAYRKQRRRLKLQQWILLAVRCLALFLLAAALARPVLQGATFGASGGRSVYILLDNSIASSARGLAPGVIEGGAPAAASSEDEVALARHKRAAAAILASLGPADRVGLITLGGPAEALVVPASSNLSSVATLIEQVRPTDAAADFAGAIERLAAQIKSDEAERGAGAVVAVLSDFPVGAADTSRPLPSALADVSGLRVLATPPTASAPTNVQITRIDPLRSVVLTGTGSQGQREQVRVSLRRTGDVSSGAVTAVRLRFAGSDGGRAAPESRATVTWQPGQSETTIAVDVEPPSRPTDSGVATVASSLIAEIDRDVIASDNVLRRPIGVRESLRVGIVARRRFSSIRSVESLTPAEWIALALRPSGTMPIDITEIDPQALDAPALAVLEVVFAPAPELLSDEAWRRLRRFVEDGGLLVVSPPPDATVHLWTDAMVRELGLAWRIAREPRSFEIPGASLDDGAEASPILSLLAAEIPALARPVRVFRALLPEELARQSDVLLRMADGEPWLVAGEAGAMSVEGEQGEAGSGHGRGLVLYLASAPTLAWTDLPAKPLMVPLLQEITRQGFGRAAGEWTTVAGRPLDLPRGTTKLVPAPTGSGGAGADDGDLSPIFLVTDGAGGAPRPVLRRAGSWLAMDEAQRLRGVIAVNADTAGARLTPNEASTVRAWLGSTLGAGRAGEGAEASEQSSVEWLDPAAPGAALSRQAVRSPWSLPLLIGALALALLEVVLARWFSYATVDRSSAESAPEAGVPSAAAAGVAA